MNKKLKILLLMIVFSIGACNPPVSPPLPDESVRTSEDYEERKRSDKDREDVIERERKNYSGDTCEELTGRDQKDCEEMCKDMYITRGDRQDCEELESDLIEDLHEAYEFLKEADDLENVSSNLFEVYLNISISGLENIIRRYKSNEAEDFLSWLLNNTEVAKIFRKEDDDFAMLEAVFKKFDGNYSNSNIHNNFIERLDGDHLMEIAITNDDEIFVEWFMEYINEKNNDCDRDTETKNCFEVYCKIGDRLDKDIREDWLDYEEFEDYISEIIEEKVNSRDADSSDNEKYNASGWRYGRSYIEDLSDIGDDWVAELCHDLRR